MPRSAIERSRPKGSGKWVLKAIAHVGLETVLGNLWQLTATMEARFPMHKQGNFRNAEVANKAYSLYQQAQMEWLGGSMDNAFRLFLAAANLGLVEAFGLVGQFYDRGEGVRADPDAALQWYRRAHRNGNAAAANNVGCILRDRGELTRALSWFDRAIELGDYDANLNAAKIHLSRQSNWEKALKYLNTTRRSSWVTEGSKDEARRLIKDSRK